MTETAAPSSTWQQAWHACAAELAASPLRRQRETAFERFLALGFPTTRMEDWRFTNLAPIAKASFACSIEPVDPAIAGPFLPFPGGARIVLVNGQHVPSLAVPSTHDGVRVESLAVALSERLPLLDLNLARHASFDRNAFVALNTAFLADGALVHVPRGTVIEEPIHIVSITTSKAGNVATHPRILVVLEEGAQATIVETHAGAGEGCFSNVVTEIALGAGAVLDHSHVQCQPASAFHVASTVARLSRDASLTSHVFSLGARLSRHDLSVELAAEGAGCALNGLSFLSGSQHADHHTFIDHAVPHGSSDQLYKGVYAGRSRGVFTGKVAVRENAQKTIAHQKNRNLLLSRDALVDTQPQLEIRADDVRCTHGATIGQLDDDQLFYLRSRAIGEADARRMLTAAFAAEIVDRVKPAALRAELQRLLAERSEVLGAAGAGE
jgi:Fe-S cluster assembly protein SufD